jgi:hypothetical protein
MSPSRLGIMRIALGVFVGNFLCLLISIVLNACLFFGLGAFGFSFDRLFR